MAIELATVEHLRLHAFGIIMHLESLLDVTQLDEILQDCLDTARDQLAEDCETFWEHTVIRQTEPAAGDEYNEVEAAFDYYPGQFAQGVIPKWTLRRRPVVSVERMQFRLSPDFRVLEVPSEWWNGHVDKRLGTVSLVPVSNIAAAAAQYAAFMLPWFNPVQMQQLIPQFCAIDYTAGWYDPDGDTLPRASNFIHDGIMSVAQLELLDRCQRIMPQGVTLDGFRQDFMSVGDHLKGLQDDVTKFKQWWNRHYRPPRIVML